ncbi:MAG TPA: YaiI/YqxD family protein [Methylomirabilota bacterium]|nr:YaiI/YqxD family protein [Methylomirabilota bacterium]
MGTVYIDADACPVKSEVYTVAERHGWSVVVVANQGMAIPREPFVRMQLVASGPDVADDYIAGIATVGDVVVTADVPLAGRCVKTGATVIAPSGKPFTEASIGMAVAVRDLMTDLRSAGAITGGPPPFSRQDRSRFLSALHQAIVRIDRGNR